MSNTDGRVRSLGRDGRIFLRLKGGKEYTVTRTYKGKLKSLAEFWIAAVAFFLAQEQ